MCTISSFILQEICMKISIYECFYTLQEITEWVGYLYASIKVFSGIYKFQGDEM